MNALVNGIINVATTTTTENGDKTFTTSLNDCVDLFFKIAAIRGQHASVAEEMFRKAYNQSPEVALRVALWLRDVREGAGERQTFRTILLWLEANEPEYLDRILVKIPDIGRWDDLFVFKTDKFVNQAMALYAYALNDGNQLAAKWAPRENSKKYKYWGRNLRDFMGLTPKQYRNLIVGLSDTVEQDICSNKWSEINYSHVPSVANARLSKAFFKHDADRYGTFINAATKGEVKINSGAIHPHDIITDKVDDKTADAMWNQLPDFIPNGVSFIPMIDVSGSMGTYGYADDAEPINVALALGMYVAERNKSAFRDLGLTFSSDPKFFRIDRSLPIKKRAASLVSAEWGMSTNLDKAMQLVLNTALTNHVMPSDMPQYLIVFSDMEFDSGVRGGYSVAERTKSQFKSAGYEVPTIIWWNIQSRNGVVPIRYNDNGILVSGFSPSLMASILSGSNNPLDAMLATVMKDRYDY